MDHRYELMLRLRRLQEENMARFLRVEDLRLQDRLKEADAESEVLVHSLETQRALTDECNAADSAGLEPLEFPFGVLLNTLLERADIVESLGRNDEAESLRREALTLAKERGAGELAKRQRQLAGTLLEKGQINEALAQLMSVRDLFVSLGDKTAAARSATDLAQAYEWLRDFERALEQVHTAYRLLDGSGVQVGAPVFHADSVADTVKQVGHDVFKSPEHMQSMLEQMKRLETQVNDQGILCDLYQVEARSLVALNHFDKAKMLFDKARPMLLGYAQPALDYQYANIKVEEGKFAEGLADIEALEPLFASGVLRRKLAAILRVKATALLALGHQQNALNVILEARRALEGFQDPDLEWKIVALEGKIRAALGDDVMALAAYDRATAVIDYLRRAPLGFRLDSLNLTNKLPVYREAITVATRLGDAGACCRFMEMVKSRQLGATLSLPGGSGNTSPLAQRIDAITNQIVALDYLGEGSASADVLVAERNELTERLRVEDPRWRTLTAPVALNLDLVLESLQSRDQAALTLFYDGADVTGVLLYDGQCISAQARLADATVAAVASYASNLGSATPEAQRFDPAATVGLDFTSLIPPALVPAAFKAQSLVIIPHLVSHLLPWAMLDCEGKRLFDYLPVGVLPNLTCVPLMKTSQVAAPKVMPVGSTDNRLAAISAEEECGSIAEIYAPRGGLFKPAIIDQQATRKAFLDLLHENNVEDTILHVACHGGFDVREPMSSGLYLSDGKVDAATVARQAIHFDEVILSACSTGQRALAVNGVELVGDELLGLVGAFIEAGTKSVLVSIPPTPDVPTLEFMKCYHDHRSQGTAPLASLQKTQRTMLTEGIFEPCQWAGFSVFGVC
jgi:tetratricopeptide (TPR) repeat protein